jgi:peptidoglycan-associated lipoprotein
MRSSLALPLLVLGSFLLTACPAKPKNGECTVSADCAAQAGFGKVCVEGRCQECGVDADCREGFVCRGNACVPKPQCGTDADCPPGQACQGERCVARAEGTCGSDRDCPEGTCQDGRCVARQATVPDDCADGAAFTIRFDFDRSELRDESRTTLQRLHDCLRRAPAGRVVIQGNCDERGTTEYNVALGSRRAEAARKYLLDLGTSGSLETVSYGEERPVCREASEPCWQRNRRDDFSIER